jgi:hypothetical protein
MIHDDSDIVKIKDLVKQVATYFHDELLINNNEALATVRAVRGGLQGVCSELAGCVVEACVKLNYTSRVNNHMADLFLALRWLANDDEALLNAVSLVLQRSLQPHELPLMKDLLLDFYHQFRPLAYNFLSFTKFRDIYLRCISSLIEKIFKKL